jgi:carboxylesterase type B
VSNTRFTNFANAAGCPASAGPPLPCLRSKTTAVLQRANYEVGQLAGSGMWYFIPVTDADEYITALPSLVLRPEHPVNGRRLLVGNNAHEGAPFVPTSIATEADLLAWLSVEFPTLASTESTRRTILAQYPLTQTMADQYTRASQIYAEAHFVCPSYWLADAFTSPSSSSNPSAKSAFHYQYSVPYASHGLDMGAVFGPAGPYRSPDVVAAMHHAWGQMVTDGEPGQGIPVWQVGRDAKQTDFDQTGGQAVVVQASWGLNVTQYMGPGLEPNIRVVDAWTWEDGRGARCEFWRGLGREIEE